MLIIKIVPLTLSPLCLVLLVRLGTYTEFVFHLFLQTHRETDRFVVGSGVQLAQSTSDQFHYRRTVFSSESQFRLKVGYILSKDETLWITLNIGLR